MVEVVCHRGANAVAPENTRAAAERCIAWGAHYVEVDVRTSKDGVLYNLHDSTVNRTTNGSGRLRDLLGEEIDCLDAGSWFSPEFAGEKLPLLEALLEAIRGRAGVFFDVKDADIHEVVAMVRRVGLEQDCFFWFDTEVKTREFRDLNTGFALKINAATVEEIAIAASEYHAKIIEVGLDTISEDMVIACRERDLKLMVLQMENDPVAFRSIIEWRADMVNLNHADTFFQVEREIQAQRKKLISP
jgi:glycerophosphoryl diester phosphodiesterase